MLIRKPGHMPPPSEITPEAVWLSRREWLARAGLAAAAASLPGWTMRQAFARMRRHCRASSARSFQ